MYFVEELTIILEFLIFSLIYSFIHSLSKHLQNIYYVPGIILKMFIIFKCLNVNYSKIFAFMVVLVNFFVNVTKKADKNN